KEGPTLKPRSGWTKWILGKERPRDKLELVEEMNRELNRALIGVDWNFSQNIRDNVMESLSGVKGDNSVKIFGPDLDVLEQLADKVKNRLEEVDESGERKIKGLENVGIFRIKGQPNLELHADRPKCKQWNVSVNDVNNVIQTAIGGKA